VKGCVGVDNRSDSWFGFWATLLAIGAWISAFRELSEYDGNWQRSLGQFGLNMAGVVTVGLLLWERLYDRPTLLLGLAAAAGFAGQQLPKLVLNILRTYLSVPRDPPGTD